MCTYKPCAVCGGQSILSPCFDHADAARSNCPNYKALEVPKETPEVVQLAKGVAHLEWCIDNLKAKTTADYHPIETIIAIDGFQFRVGNEVADKFTKAAIDILEKQLRNAKQTLSDYLYQPKHEVKNQANA